MFHTITIAPPVLSADIIIYTGFILNDKYCIVRCVKTKCVAHFSEGAQKFNAKTEILPKHDSDYHLSASTVCVFVLSYVV